jgi:hypothetical protein
VQLLRLALNEALDRQVTSVALQHHTARSRTEGAMGCLPPTLRRAAAALAITHA